MSALAQTYTTTGGAGIGLFFLYFLVVYAILVIPLWVIFTKAGQPGWGALIPIYSFYVILKIVGRSGWWLLLLLIPLVNFIILIVVYNDLSRSFGHGLGFTLGLVFLSLIFYYILAFGSSRYIGPAGAIGSVVTTPPPPPPMPLG